MSDASPAAVAEVVHVVPAEARAYQGRRAGVVTRLLAIFVDAGIAFGLLLATYVAWAGALFVWHGRTFRFPSVTLEAAIVAGAVILIGYCTLGWSGEGRTYGCSVLGLRVVGRGGRSLGVGVAFVRALLTVVFPIGFLWCAVSAQNRSVQDLLLGTSVVYDWEVRPRSAR